MLHSFRPHTLKYHIETSVGHYDENHDWQEGRCIWSGPIKCRYEPNGRADTIALPDGAAYTYSYVVYLGLSSRGVKYGDRVRLFDQEGNIIDEKSVQGISKGQLNIRIWL